MVIKEKEALKALYADDITHLVTHLVWPHQPENPPGRPRARRISP